jgi:hypothetical protein
VRTKRPRLLATLYPFVDAYYDMDFERSSVRMGELYEDTKQLLEARKSILPEGMTFLNGMMDDSWLLSVQRSAGDVVLTINEFMTHCFCEAYNTLRQRHVHHKRVITRLNLRFSGAASIGVCRENSRGRLLPVSAVRYLPYFDELLLDEIKRLDENGVEMGFLFTNSRAFRNTLVLEVKADKLIIEESLREDCIAVCGADVAPYFDAFMEFRKSSPQSLGYSCSLEFLKGLGIPEPH